MMEKQYDKKNKGVLFINYKKKTEKHPDYTGEIFIGDVKMRLAGWQKKSAKREEYLSLSVSEWQDQNQDQPKRKEFIDDEKIPF
jgi:uncharacterized protein (DUF736 family)